MMELSWDMLALFGITLSFSITTIIFMLSYFFSNEFLKSWSREEFFNIFTTLLLFGTLFSLVNLDLFTSNVQEAKSYVNQIFHNALNIQIDMLSDVSTLSLIGSLSYSFNLNSIASMGKGGTHDFEVGEFAGSISSSISLQPLLSPFTTSFSTLQVYSFVPMTMIKLHVLLIDFVEKDAGRSFPILLAMGIFLRAFKFTRNAGNTILALFISLYFILPVIYLFNESVINTVIQPPPSNSFLSELMNLMMNKITDNDSYIGEDIFKMTLPTGKLYGFIVTFFIESFLLPYISIIIALGIAREFAMTLGSNVDFSSLVRLV